MPLGKTVIDWDGAELLVSFTPYRPDISSEIKSALPQHARTWDSEDKVWRISTIYFEQICEIFDVFEYSVRDYTGDDQASKIRQAGLRATREARANDAARREKAKAEARASRDREEKAKWEKAKKEERHGYDPADAYDRKIFEDDAEGASWAREAQARDAKTKKENFESEHGPNSWEAWIKRQREQEKIKWRERFFKVWPECEERHFILWYGWFLLDGQDEANRKFHRAYYQEQNAKNGTNYDWRAGYQQRRSSSYGENFWGHNGGTQTVERVDHYAVLGIVRTCTLEEAKTAYLQLARKYHPNSTFQGGTPDEVKMRALNHSWDEIKLERGWKT